MKDTDSAIEMEVQARVNFKMNELIDSIKNHIRNYDSTSVTNGMVGNMDVHYRYLHYKEAFHTMLQMISKEWRMETPYDDMAERKLRKAEELAINQIMSIPTIERLRGNKGYDEQLFRQSLHRAISKAQEWQFSK